MAGFNDIFVQQRLHAVGAEPATVHIREESMSIPNIPVHQIPKQAQRALRALPTQTFVRHFGGVNARKLPIRIVDQLPV